MFMLGLSGLSCHVQMVGLSFSFRGYCRSVSCGASGDFVDYAYSFIRLFGSKWIYVLYDLIHRLGHNMNGCL